MTDRYHRFRLEIAGETLFGVAFASEAELEAFLAGRHETASTPAPRDDPRGDAQRQRGRPSFDAAIAAAVAALETELAACDSVSGRARMVLRHLAETRTAEDIPSTRTVTAYLADHRVGKKVGNKYGRNSPRAKIRRTGG